MNADWLGPIMFIAAFALIFSGYPVAFALGGTALAFAAIGVQMGVLDWALLFAMPERIFGVRRRSAARPLRFRRAAMA